jgi:uncharacterized protein YgiM (DUF1202 family)
MQPKFIARWLGTAGALAVAFPLIASAQTAPPPGGYSYSGTSGRSAGHIGTAAQPRDIGQDGGYGSTAPDSARSFIADRQTVLRQGPRDGFDIIAVLPAGTRVTTDGYVGGDWWQVQSKYGTGWVYSRDLTLGG